MRKQYKETKNRWRKNNLKYFRDWAVNSRLSGKRELVFKRDKYSCRICGMSNEDHKKEYGSELSVHHKDNNGYYSKAPNNKLINLIAICIPCHMNIHTPRRCVIRLNDGKIYASLTEAGKDNNLTPCAIRKICTGENHKTHKGLIFRYYAVEEVK